MANNVIGFAGIDKYELILYLSRIIFHLGKKVLLVDDSESEALYQCIPVPESLREAICPIHYRGMDFILGKYYHADLGLHYDVVILDLGFQLKADLVSECTRLFYVIDLQLHNIRKLRLKNQPEDIPMSLIIKDVFPCKIKPEIIMEQWQQDMNLHKGYILYLDTLDLKYKIQSQYDSVFQFQKVSAPVTELLKDIVKQMDFSLQEKEIKQAYHKAERGR